MKNKPKPSKFDRVAFARFTLAQAILGMIARREVVAELVQKITDRLADEMGQDMCPEIMWTQIIHRAIIFWAVETIVDMEERT